MPAARNILSHVVGLHIPTCRQVLRFLILLCICNVRLKCSASTSGVQHLRKLSTAHSLANRPPEEIAIPVPYGQLAAKVWPAKRNRNPKKHLLCLHGGQDNAGSFDPLLEKLDGGWQAVALDFTGHGLSSHLPKGCVYTTTHLMLDIARTVQFLGWDQFNLLGHSIGGLVGHRYASVFPQKVSKLILVEGFGEIYEARSQLLGTVRTTLQSFLRLEEKHFSRQRSYTEEEIMALYAKMPWGCIRADDVKVLMKRGCQLQADGRYNFTRDIRLKALYWEKVDKAALDPWWKSFKNDILVLDAVPGFGSCSVQNGRMINALKKHCRTFQMAVLDGDHHIHMNQPELVASYIRPFLDDLQGTRNQMWFV
ncbi:serine hydrolase-like protein isoform X3 [Dermacentor variabilis]